jgi:hypothetical protein
MNKGDDTDLPHAVNKSMEEVQEMIIESLRQIAISTQRTEMAKESRDSIQQSVAAIEAGLIRKFSA